MSIKSAILLSAALCLGVITSALAQTSGSSGSSTGNNDTGYDSARTGDGVPDSYNGQGSKTVPSAGDAYGPRSNREGRAGTAGKHGGASHDGGTAGGKDGGM
jgi:hypothetical protein